jgi:hypothetical protein
MERNLNKVVIFVISLSLSLSLSPNDTRTMTTLKTTVCQLCRWLADSSPTACQQLKKTVPKKRPSDTFVSTLTLEKTMEKEKWFSCKLITLP